MRLNQSQTRWTEERREAVARAFPPVALAILRELCDRIEHGGKKHTPRTSAGRRNVSEEDLKTLFPSKKEDFDLDKVVTVLTNVYSELVWHCVDHCEDFGASTPEAFCRQKTCVQKSILRVLARILHNEIHFHMPRGKTKERKRRIEICDE